jgi:hypothetical protein
VERIRALVGRLLREPILMSCGYLKRTARCLQVGLSGVKCFSIALLLLLAPVAAIRASVGRGSRAADQASDDRAQAPADDAERNSGSCRLIFGCTSPECCAQAVPIRAPTGEK